jgi:hypothetical protein
MTFLKEAWPSTCIFFTDSAFWGKSELMGLPERAKDENRVHAGEYESLSQRN